MTKTKRSGSAKERAIPQSWVDPGKLYGGGGGIWAWSSRMPSTSLIRDGNLENMEKDKGI